MTADPRTPLVTRDPRRWAVDLGAVVLLLAVPIVGFWPTYGGPGYLPAAVGGALLGIAIAVVSAWRRWGVLATAGLTIAAYFVFGGALALPHTTVAGFVPTLGTLAELTLGVVTSWKQLLTTVAPVPVGEGFVLVPFLLALVAAVLTASLALRASAAAWALVPAGAFLVAQIALGTSDPALPVVEGVVFAVVSAGWLAVRQAWAPSHSAVSLGDGSGAHGGARVLAARRLALGSGVVAVAVVAGIAASGAAAPAAPRYVLRDVVIPPFDIHEFPSPLQSFRAIVRDDAESELFTVSGLPQNARVRIAAMDAYSGMVYNVSDDGAGSSSAFTPVRSGMSPDATGGAATVRVQIGEYDSVWMPEVGAVAEVRFDGERSDDLRRSAHYNAATQTGVVTLGLQEGDAYEFDAIVAATPTDQALADVPFAPVKMPEQQGVPEALADLASQTVADATTPIEQVRALQQMLSDRGYFSHGLEGQPLSRAGHGAERIASMVGADQMVGDDEQYATTMALLAREVGIPARVVMGFYPGTDRTGEPVFTATGDDLHAWVEVAFDGVGWVSFDPTPPEDQVPSDETPKPKADPKPQVLQPPPPQQEPVDLPPTVPDDRGEDDETESDSGVVWLIAGIAGSVLLLLALLAAPFIVIGALKAARRRRRKAAERPADRISGGWDELVDRATDHGAAVVAGATRQEDAGIVEVAFAQPAVATLARRADAQVFGPAEPTPADIDEFWRQVDEIVGGMRRSRSVWRRLGARLSIRTLLAGTRFALPPRSPGALRSSRGEARRRRAASGAGTSSPEAPETP